MTAALLAVKNMSAISTLSFLVKEFGDYKPVVYAVVPVIDGVPMTDLVAAFEESRHFDPVGGYGGLVPQFFNYGSLDQYFNGCFEQGSYWERLHAIYLLGCDCGEVGCWPLLCRIRMDGNIVVWEAFKQEHRPERDYSRFGPFVFDAKHYRNAVAKLQMEVAAQNSGDSNE